MNKGQTVKHQTNNREETTQKEEGAVGWQDNEVVVVVMRWMEAGGSHGLGCVRT